VLPTKRLLTPRALPTNPHSQPGPFPHTLTHNPAPSPTPSLTFQVLPTKRLLTPRVFGGTLVDVPMGLSE